MLPAIVVVIPVYMIFRSAGLLDNQLSLAFTYLALTVPISVWILSRFIEDLPVELDEAALVDGATRLQILLKVVLPLVRPGLAAAAVLCLLYTWNEFLYALILTGRDAKSKRNTSAMTTKSAGVAWQRGTVCSCPCGPRSSPPAPRAGTSERP
jgi:multiple sugar transport system permease protein